MRTNSESLKWTPHTTTSTAREPATGEAVLGPMKARSSFRKSLVVAVPDLGGPALAGKGGSGDR